MKILLEVLLTLALIGLRRTKDYNPERERRIFHARVQRSADVFPELHLKDYETSSSVGFLSFGNKGYSCACGQANPGKPKKGSEDVVHPPYKYPWMVAFKRAGDPHVFCGGTLISDKFVLTAAHCLDRNPALAHRNEAEHVDLWNPREITVSFVTETEKLQPGPPVAKLIPHSRFNFKNVNHDIGLVQLSRPVPCGMFTRPICLSPLGIPVTVGKLFSITGWGIEEVGAAEGPSELLEGKIRHVSFSMCEDKFPWKMKENYYCLKGTQGQSPCHGDSGGPMFKKDYQGTYYLLGVASMHSSPKCDSNDVFIYTSVSKHLMWMRAVIGMSSSINHSGLSPKGHRLSSPVRQEISSPNFMTLHSMNGFPRRRSQKKFCRKSGR